MTTVTGRTRIKKEYAEIRRNLLKMARKNVYLDGGVSVEEFETLGDETVDMIRRLREAE